MDNNSREITERRMEALVFSHRDMQDRFVYYLLAINAGCIAFAVNLTKDYKLSTNEVPLGVSVIFWSISFYSGIVQIQNIEVSTQLNIKKLQCYLSNTGVPDWIETKVKETIHKGVIYRSLQNWAISREAWLS
ncbi:hypothetical protein IDJ77_18345 [Mucilaginibacter sp. ZT4R22]|uniref:SMODS and SLOG-associating 2TM effector domain-containing protein n=1 Tax=Mucilaginibacter pankratovii TaxID=2772110 RepID=A0ABR7WU01_9SPHI|nr:hypothetical protein [Mucilaginibacter pankratovii]MBD1365783.1 hypothetical protein [Mucilaginibacter pankratovii]